METGCKQPLKYSQFLKGYGELLANGSCLNIRQLRRYIIVHLELNFWPSDQCILQQLVVYCVWCRFGSEQSFSYQLYHRRSWMHGCKQHYESSESEPEQQSCRLQISNELNLLVMLSEAEQCCRVRWYFSGLSPRATGFQIVIWYIIILKI